MATAIAFLEDRKGRKGAQMWTCDWPLNPSGIQRNVPTGETREAYCDSCGEFGQRKVYRVAEAGTWYQYEVKNCGH